MNKITTLREICDAICAVWNFKLELPSRISIVLYYPIIFYVKGIFRYNNIHGRNWISTSSFIDTRKLGVNSCDFSV